jgi:hypothetical protein
VWAESGEGQAPSRAMQLEPLVLMQKVDGDPWYS